MFAAGVYSPTVSDPGPDGISPAQVSACAQRGSRLRQALAGARVDALLIGHPTDIRYLTGFHGDDSLLLVPTGDDEALIITDSRHDELLNPWRTAGIARVAIGTRHRLAARAATECEGQGLNRIGIQAEHTTITGRRHLADALGEGHLVETEGLVGRLRVKKDDLEIAAIEAAAMI